jgi:dTDP-glucose pyrophosphorylase
MTIVLTMAGAGSRFRNAGHGADKHRIQFRGHSLFEWSLVSLREFRSKDLVVVTRRFEAIEPFVADIASRLGFAPPRFIYADRLTRGQAESAALARELVGGSEPVLVYNTDTFVDPVALKPERVRGDGWIPCFRAPGDKWSFVDADDSGRVLRVTEKQRISDHCSVGLYYFRRFDFLLEHVDRMADGSEGEWYIAPLYNRLIADGRTVYLEELPVDAVCVLGTPEDLLAAEARALEFPA